MEQDPRQEIDKEALAEELKRQHAALISDDDEGGGIDTYQEWADRLFRHTPWHRWLFGVWLLLLLFWSMHWQYSYANFTKEVAKLEERVKDLRYRHLFVTAELVRHERISSVEEEVVKQGLNLEHSSQPPYLIEPDQKQE